MLVCRVGDDGWLIQLGSFERIEYRGGKTRLRVSALTPASLSWRYKP